MATSSMASLCEAPWQLRRFRPLQSPLKVFPAASATLAASRRGRSIMFRVRAAGGASNGMPVSGEREIPQTQSAGVEEGYVGLYVRMLGLDNPIEEREEAVHALWKHAQLAKRNVDDIVMFPKCLNLVVTLLASDRPTAVEAAAGLLREVSACEECKFLVAEAGAIEEIAGLLTRKQVETDVIEQALYVLRNMSSDSTVRNKIASPELLPVLMSMLGSEQQEVQAAAAGIIANLSCSENLHGVLLESGAVKKLAAIMTTDARKKQYSPGVSRTAPQQVARDVRAQARNALLELSKNSDAKAAIIEEGLLFVPVIGADAYKSVRRDIEEEQLVPPEINLNGPLGSKKPCPWGSTEVMLGLNMDKVPELDEATQLAIQGRATLSFMKRLGIVEQDLEKPFKREMTILPWWDAIPRLILILGLQDLEFAKKGAVAIIEAATVEDYRQKLAMRGAICHLVYLLGTGDESVMEVAAHAIEKLAMSQKARSYMNTYGVIPALVRILHREGAPESLQEKVLEALARLSQTQEEVKAMLRSGNVAGILDITNSQEISDEAKAELENVLREISSLQADPRDKVVETGGIPPLIKLFSGDSYSLKQRSAGVLENLATKEVYAIQIAEAGIDSALKLVFQTELEGLTEEAGLWPVTSAASRLLGKLLNFEIVRGKLDCPAYISFLSKILKSEAAPLFVKDWVSACLLKLVNSSTIPNDLLDVPINKEVTVHDTIPRLVEEMKTGSTTAQEAAVLQLRDLISCGLPEYVAAIANRGGIFPVVEIMGNAGSSEARAAALSVLYNLGMNNENHPAIMAAGAVPYLQRLVRGEVDGWKLALDLLRMLPT